MKGSDNLKQADAHLSIALVHLNNAQNLLAKTSQRGQPSVVRRAIRARDLISIARDKVTAGREVLSSNS